MADWHSDWDQTSAAAVCRLLDCGSAVSTKITEDSADRLVWWIKSSCVQSASALLDCVILTRVNETYAGIEVICSGNRYLKLLSQCYKTITHTSTNIRLVMYSVRWITRAHYFCFITCYKC